MLNLSVGQSITSNCLPRTTALAALLRYEFWAMPSKSKLLFQEGEYQASPVWTEVARRDVGQSGQFRRAPLRGRRKIPVAHFVIQNRQTDLLEVVLTLQPAGGLPRRLHRWKQQSDQDADDRDYNE